MSIEIDIHNKKITEARNAGLKEGFLKGLQEAHKMCVDILKYWDGAGRENPARPHAGKQTKYIMERIEEIVKANK